MSKTLIKKDVRDRIEKILNDEFIEAIYELDLVETDRYLLLYHIIFDVDTDPMECLKENKENYIPASLPYYKNLSFHMKRLALLMVFKTYDYKCDNKYIKKLLVM
ncbi:MAG: hypothetical protein E7214_03660 [Clostridium sp.]|nr:hypothetical protein [Clostridium sp.]